VQVAVVVVVMEIPPFQEPQVAAGVEQLARVQMLEPQQVEQDKERLELAEQLVLAAAVAAVEVRRQQVTRQVEQVEQVEPVAVVVVQVVTARLRAQAAQAAQAFFTYIIRRSNG
jgi:hypothetical protein